MSQAWNSNPLDIPDGCVLDVQVDQDWAFIIAIESTRKAVRCQTRRQVIGEFHGYADWITVQHRSILG